jgi:hypothetical protein
MHLTQGVCMFLVFIKVRLRPKAALQPDLLCSGARDPECSFRIPQIVDSCKTEVPARQWANALN